jgi:hypothetical protein
VGGELLFQACVPHGCVSRILKVLKIADIALQVMVQTTVVFCFVGVDENSLLFYALGGKLLYF